MMNGVADDMKCTVRMRTEGSDESFPGVLSTGADGLPDGFSYESMTEDGGRIRNAVSITGTGADDGYETGVRVIRSGVISSDMLFVPGRETEMSMETSYGTAVMHINTESAEYKRSSGQIAVELRYIIMEAPEEPHEIEYLVFS